MSLPLSQRAMAFRPAPRSVLWLTVDLRMDHLSRIDFWDEDRTNIVLHASIRRDEGCIVLNRHWDTGWRREVPFALPLSEQVHELALVFGPEPFGTVQSCTLWLDRQRFAKVDMLPRPSRAGRMGLRRGFPGLDHIRWVELDPNINIKGQSRDTRGAGLTDRMELAWQGPSPPAALILPDGDRLTLNALAPAGPGGGFASTVLPGRIWHPACDEPAKLALINAQGQDAGEVKVHRDDLLGRLEHVARTGWIAHDGLCALQALEHARAANAYRDLSPACLAALDAAARRFRLDGFRPDGPAPRPATLKQVDTVAALIAEFQEGASSGPALERLEQRVRSSRLTGIRLGHVGLGLSEWACRNDNPAAFFALLHRHGAVYDSTASPFAASASLPRLWAEQNWPDFRAALAACYPAQGKWIVTPALGWTLRALIHDWPTPSGHIKLADRADAVLELLRTMRKLAQGTGSQMRSPVLLGAVAEVIAGLDRFPDNIAATASWIILQTYGLSPEFWDRVAAMETSDHFIDWQDWAQMAALLNTAMPGKLDPNAKASLARFEQAGIVGADHFRRCLIPEGGHDATASAAPLALAPPLAQEAALRWLAFPRDDRGKPPPQAVHQLACAGLKPAASHVTRAPGSRVMVRTGALCLSQLADLRQGKIPPDINKTRKDAATLLAPEVGFCGGPVLLALAEALATHGALDMAASCLNSLKEGLRNRSLADVASSTALRHASARFAACCPDAGLSAHAASFLRPAPELTGPDSALRRNANPLTDTLVVLISCRPYLIDRVPAIKAAWGDMLAQAGLPMVVAVGGGTGPACLADGVLHLPVPDDYEGLPQKSLGLADWAVRETGFSRILKIDDDCFLDPNAFFADLSALCFPYYGRPLRRTMGEMDRAWHMGKATTARGRADIDKSPEPAIYADGGAGYVLARDALLALRSARDTPEGRALEAVSFMEDKLVGDLLALRGIAVSGENYDMSIFRRSAAGLPPLPQYENSFLPFAGAGLKIAHLDGGGNQMAARRAAQSPWPEPMKIWPTHGPARLGWARNTLDLVSPTDRLAQAQQAEVAVVAVMRNERFLLDQFLDHYRRLGVGAFLVADNGSDDGTLEHLVAQPDVIAFATDTPYNESQFGVIWQEALLANFRVGRWSLVADADEFLFWNLPDAAGRVPGNLPELLNRPAFSKADMVRLSMLDLYPAGALSDAHFANGPFMDATHIDRAPLRFDYDGRGPWGNCDSVTSNLRHRLMEDMGQPAARNLFVAQKFALLRYQPSMLFSAGLHYAVGGCVAAPALAFAHFKYSAAFHAKARAEVARGQHFNNAEEYRKYLTLMSEGRDTLFDPDISVPLAECPFVQQMIATS